MLKSICKKLLLISFVLFLTLPAHAEEYIKHFNSDIWVNIDGSLSITETITVHHEGNLIKRGIYRDLSTAKHERYKVISVTRNGNPEPWFTEKTNNALRVNTGNDDFLPAPATSTFTITYNMYDALRPIKNMDLNEIYLNITGRWSFPIKLVTTQIHYPEGTKIASRYAYLEDKSYEVAPTQDYIFTDLNPGAQLTIAEAFSKDVVNVKLPIAWRAIIAAFIIMFVYYFIAWLIWGIDPPSRAIMPDWEPPADLSPLECAYIINDGKAPKNSFLIHILWLVYKKAADMRELQKGQFAKPNGFEIKPLPTADNSNHEISLFTSRYKNGMTIYASEPDEDLADYDKKLDQRITAHLEKTAYHKRNLLTFLGALFVPIALLIFWKDPNLFNAALFAAITLPPLLSCGIFGIITACLLLYLPIILNLIEMDSLLVTIFGLYVATVMVFKYLMFQPTVYGQRQKEKIKGIKMFLGTITQNKNIALKEHLPLRKNYDMSMHNRLTPEDMEALFPYAVALGLEKEWERKFKSIFDTKQWIAMTDRNFYYRNRDFHNFHRCYSSALKATQATSAGRYSSGRGSFGGGFSGGGFGGGGGGGR